MPDTLTNGWFSFASRRPGPAAKTYDVTNAQTGWVCHSMEGWWATNDTLDHPDRGSWHGTLRTKKNGGDLIQHYPTSASPWASGSRQANTTFVAWELEGVAGTPMDEAQLATAIRMYRAWRAAKKPQLVRAVSLFNHNEVATRWTPNAGPTACPSNRWEPFYKWLVSNANDVDYDEEEDMARIDDMQRTIDAQAALLTDARGDIYQLQTQVFGEEAAKAGRTSAYVLDSNKQVVTIAELYRRMLTAGQVAVDGQHVHALPGNTGPAMPTKG